jgi:ubiquitin C-terminal hydrolase
MVAQKDLLASTWKCKEMSHLAGYDQFDAHEFLHAFLEVLGYHTSNLKKLVWQTLNKKKAGDANPAITNSIEGMFQGTLRTVLLCQECGAKRVQKELFLSLSIDLLKEVQKISKCWKRLSP